MENIGGAHAVLAFHAQRQMGIGSAIGVQILGLAVIGLAPQLVEPGLGFLKGSEMLYRGLLLGIGGPCFQIGNDVKAPFPACLRRGGAALGQCLFGTFPHIVPQRHRIEGGIRGKAHVIENVVHIGLFQGSCWVVVGPCGGVAHLAAGNIMVQSRFQMGTDFAVHGQRHIVPANITAGLFVGSLVELHIEQRVGLQALLGRDLVVLGFPLQQRGQGRFLDGLDDLRVVLYQSTVDTFRLHLDRLGFRRQVVADKQGRAVVKTNRHIAGAAPFAGTGGRVDFAGLTAKRLRDHINFGLQGQVFVSVSDFQRLFLQLRQGFGRGRLRLGVGSNLLRRGGFRLRHGFLFRLRLWCRFLFRDGFLCRLLLFLGIQLLDGFLRQLPGIKLIHQLPAPFRRPDVENIPNLGPAVVLRDIGLQHIQVFPAVAAGVGVYPVEVVRLGLFLCHLRPLLPAAVALQLRGLDAGKGLNTSNPVRRTVGIVVQKPLPCAHTRRPAETVLFQLLAGVRFRLAVKEHLQAALIPVGLHMAAVKLPAHIGHFVCAGQAFDPLPDAADFRIVVGQLPALKRLLFIVPAGRHICFQVFKVFRREVRAAVQRTVFAVIGIDRFHGFLRLF